KPVPKVPDEVMDLLVGYAWPGNVRELQNEIERALVRMDAGAKALSRELFSEELQAPPPAALAGSAQTPGDLRVRMAAYEKRVLEEALAAHGGKRSSAAAALGLTRQGLAKKLERFGLAQPSAGSAPEDDDED